jgi:hypothetical protein
MKRERMRLGALLKANFLLYGINIQRDALDGVGTKYKENQYGYDNPNWTDNERLPITPSEVMLPGDLVAAVRHKPNSPFKIKKSSDDESLIVEKDGKEIGEVEWCVRPKFFDKKTSDGVLMKNIGTVYGDSVLATSILNDCEFWETGEQCRFCSIHPTYKKMNVQELLKTPQQIRELTIEAFKDDNLRLKNIGFTSGSYYDRNFEIRLYSHVFNAMRDVVPWRRIRGVAVSMPPEPGKYYVLEELYHSGIENVEYNLEIYDDKIREKLIPAKARFGLANYFKAFEESVKVFGWGNVWTLVILGLEPVESSIKAIEDVSKIGVTPGLTIFHPDMYTALSKHHLPEMQDVIKAYQRLAEIYYDTNLLPFLNSRALRSSLAWEAYFGLFDDVNEKDKRSYLGL